MTRKHTATYPPVARLIAGAIAALTIAALAIQPWLGTGTPARNALGLLQFFTIWSNIAAAALLGWIAVGRRVPPAALAALATALTVVGLVYWALLAGEHHPAGIDRLTNQVYHTITPAAAVLWWLRYAPPSPAILPLLPAVMVPPLSYGIFAFVLGELTGFYAYFFLDLPAMGWIAFLVSNAVLAVFFAVLGAGLLAIKNALHRRSALS